MDHFDKFQELIRRSERWKVVSLDCARKGFISKFLLNKGQSYIHVSTSQMASLKKSNAVYDSESSYLETLKRCGLANAAYLVLSSDRKKLLGITDFNEHWEGQDLGCSSGKRISDGSEQTLDFIRSLAYLNIHMKIEGNRWRIRFENLVGLKTEMELTDDLTIPLPPKQPKVDWYSASSDKAEDLCPRCGARLGHPVLGIVASEICERCGQHIDTEQGAGLQVLKNRGFTEIVINDDFDVLELHTPDDKNDVENARGFHE